MPVRPSSPDSRQNPVEPGGTDDAPLPGMTVERIQLFTGKDGHTGTLTYALADHGGWDVRVELDDRLVAVRHCVEWHGVEHVSQWLRLKLR